MRERLAAHGLSVDDDLAKLENVLASAKAANYDVSLMLDLASSCNSLSKKKKDIASENQVMENKIQQNKGIIQQQALTITRNSIALDELEELKRMGIAFPQIHSLKRVIPEVAAARGLDPAKAMEQFLNDVGQNYDSVLGLAVKVQQRQNELAKAENELDILRIEYVADKRAIEAISVLHSKGVKNSEIISIKTLVESQDDGAIVKLESELAYYGSLQNATGEFEQEKKELEKTLQTLRTEIDLLESKKSALEGALRGAANDFVKEVSALKDVVNEVQVTARSALDTIDSTTHLTKAKIEEIGVVAHVTMERYKSSRDFLDLGSF